MTIENAQELRVSLAQLVCKTPAEMRQKYLAILSEHDMNPSDFLEVLAQHPEELMVFLNSVSEMHSHMRVSLPPRHVLASLLQELNYPRDARLFAIVDSAQAGS